MPVCQNRPQTGQSGGNWKRSSARRNNRVTGPDSRRPEFVGRGQEKCVRAPSILASRVAILRPFGDEDLTKTDGP
ncbi:MAG: hypothetical protein VB858_07105, partial [Planctomycetaceae bacterium]